MINPAILCVPAMTAGSRQSYNQQESCWLPTTDIHAARRRMEKYLELYVDKLREVGFEVCTWQDVVKDAYVVKVRKGDLWYCELIDHTHFEDVFYMSDKIQYMVRCVERMFTEKEKEKDNVNY